MEEKTEIIGGTDDKPPSCNSLPSNRFNRMVAGIKTYLSVRQGGENTSCFPCFHRKFARSFRPLHVC